jgi:hypothetical protein
VRRRASQNKTPNRSVTIMTPSSAFEAKLARSSDAMVLRGKFLLSNVVSGTPNSIIALTPVNFGARAAAAATIFTSYRIKKIGIKFNGQTTNSGVSNAAAVVLGILDDASGAEGDAPSTANGVLELRCSAVSMPAETISTELTWSPVDKNLWYHTSSGSSTSDPRFLFPGVVYIAALSTGNFITAEFDWEVVFKGASDTGTL